MFKNVNVALAENGMTKGDLAKALDVTQSTLSLKLNGKSPITLKEAKTIKSILNYKFSLDVLFSDTA